ncbi:MAG: CehA/McbA family metallohydrolase [Gemmatimonadota bacterium]
MKIFPPLFSARPRHAGAVLAALALVLLGLPALLQAQWNFRYTPVEGYGHHVYLEGYELPTLSTGVMDPAPSPDGRFLAFSSRGWIWVLELETGTARRVTREGEMDFRPTWSPDGNRLALVRDSGEDTWVVVVQAATGREVEAFQTPAIDLDPAYSHDGRHLYYSSAREGTLDLWRVELATGMEERITRERGIQLRPQPHPDGVHLLYLSKAGGRDQVRMRNRDTGEERVLVETSIASQARPALSPDGGVVALNWPLPDGGWELRIFSVDAPTLPVVLTGGTGALPLVPSWSPDGEWIYYSHASPQGSMDGYRIRANGGSPEPIVVRSWDWEGPTGRIRVRTSLAGSLSPAAARLNVMDASGHPAIPNLGQPRFDGENGRVFFYSPGVVELTVPAGQAQITAVQGFATEAVDRMVTVRPGETVDLAVELDPLWDAVAEGWISGEHHFHLNYGGPFQVAPEDLFLKMAGEAMEAATPLVANLHNRFGEQDLWGWSRLGTPPFVHFGQEVRSHFLGHVALMNTRDLFWPWVWGPGYQLYAADDRPNAEALRFGRSQGGLGTYVHVVGTRDPFSEGNQGSIPVGLIPDAVLGDVDAFEMVCLWANDLGTSELWYRFLNLGIPIAANAGSDVMTDFYRTMAIGSSRVFVRAEADGGWPAYMTALREGRSFVSTGPFLDFQVAGGGGDVGGVGAGGEEASGWVRPGGAAPSGVVRWRLDLRSPTAVDTVEIVVNGQVVETLAGLSGPGARVLEGEVELPEGGWVAARAHGGEPTWPVMAEFPFAHSSPIWIGERGSVDPAAASMAAQELLQALEVAEGRLHAGYGEVEIPRLQARYDEARERLEGWVR